MAKEETIKKAPELDYVALLDDVEKQFRLTQSTSDVEARRASYLSTGLLSTDLILGGGLLPGAWYTIYGQEQSAKSTSIIHIMKSAMNYDLPIIASFDFEGCITEDTNLQVKTETGEVSIELRDLIPDNVDLDSLEHSEAFLPKTNVKVTSGNGHGDISALYFKGVKPITKITLENGVTLKGYKHPIAIISPKENNPFDMIIKYVHLEELSIGDFVLVSKNLCFTNEVQHTPLCIVATYSCALSKVVSIESLPAERVWDVTVENAPLSHQFFANGILTHNSQDPGYVQNILNTLGDGTTTQDMFGLRNSKGKWSKAPKIRLYTESVAETFFDSMASLFRSLPDKLFVDGQWYLVYERTKANISAFGKHADKQLSSSTGALYVKTDNPYPQALIFVDSYPMMFPDKLDEDGKGAGMASTARMFSENMPKIASKLKRKAITVVGVNQLRLRPAVMFGNPEYEPAGETVKYISSARLKNTPRAVPKDLIPGGKGQLHEETSVFNPDTVDTYRYIHQFTFKNKTFSAQLEAWQRIWVRDHEGTAHGFCPVFDLYMYLRYTGQLTGNMKKLSINTDFGVNIEDISFFELKSLILLQGKELIDFAKSLGLKKNVLTLRQECFNQVRSGRAHELFFDAGDVEEDDEYEAVDDEDEGE